MSIVLSFVQPFVGRKRVLIYFVLQHHINDKVKYLHCAQSTIAVSRCTDLARAEDRLYSIRGFLQRKFKQVLNEQGFLSFLKPSLSHTARYAPSPRFQKHLKIHAKIAQPILLPLHNPLAEFLVNGLTSKYALLTYCVKF